jgi:hypothetical protein
MARTIQLPTFFLVVIVLQKSLAAHESTEPQGWILRNNVAMAANAGAPIDLQKKETNANVKSCEGYMNICMIEP